MAVIVPPTWRLIKMTPNTYLVYRDEPFAILSFTLFNIYNFMATIWSLISLEGTISRIDLGTRALLSRTKSYKKLNKMKQYTNM